MYALIIKKNVKYGKIQSMQIKWWRTIENSYNMSRLLDIN